MIAELWTELYRPQTLDEYVWRDPEMRVKVEEWITEGGVPHLLFSGIAGTGKTSLALLLLRELNIPNEDFLKINASRERTIEKLQDKIISFINCWAFNPSGIKYILLDEADKLSQTAQGMLRGEMETYASSCRFIMTCNYPHKIIPALHSRLQEIKFVALDRDEFIMRAADVLDAEKVTFEPEVLMAYVEKIYPDLRKCIGFMQQRTIAGVLHPPKEDDETTKDYLIQVVEMFRKGHIIEARKLIIQQADPEDYESVYQFFYRNLELFGKTQSQQDDALEVIAKYLRYDGQVADREINLSACLSELTRIGQPNI